MRIISHRGYLNGPDDSIENNPKHIENIINQYGFDIEIDLWMINPWNDKKKFYLGHNEPKYEIKYNFLKKYCDNLWVHCKNIEALSYLSIFMSRGDFINYFWHQEDNFALTSIEYIWCHYRNENKDIPNGSIKLYFDIRNITTYEIVELKNKYLYAICTDYPILLKEKFNSIVIK